MNAADSVRQNADALLAMAQTVEHECSTDAIYALLEDRNIRQASLILSRPVAKLDATRPISIAGRAYGNHG